MNKGCEGGVEQTSFHLVAHLCFYPVPTATPLFPLRKCVHRRRTYFPSQQGEIISRDLFFFYSISHLLFLLISEHLNWKRVGELICFSILVYPSLLAYSETLLWTVRWDCLQFGDHCIQSCWSCLSYYILALSSSSSLSFHNVWTYESVWVYITTWNINHCPTNTALFRLTRWAPVRRGRAVLDV